MTLPCIQAPAAWQRIDFISDLHLDAGEPATFAAWAQHMAHTPADALFILGDLFEVWVGDDNTDTFALECQQVLRLTAQRIPVYFMCGNRDFLVGAQFLNTCQVTNLSDPTVLQWGDARWLLSHGDEACIDDVDYQVFRRMVRSTAWQQNFLSKSLAEREQIARDLRSQSESHKQDATSTYADVDTGWAQRCLTQSQSNCLLHGHTHRPADHALGQNPAIQRRVLSDWDLDGTKPRAEVLRWHAHGLVERINLLT